MSWSSIRYLLPWICHWTLFWFLLQIHPNSRYRCLCLARRASSVRKFPLHLLWGELGSLWSYRLFHWLCYFWGIVWFPSTSLQTLTSHHRTTLGLVPYSLAILPGCSCWLLQLLLPVPLTSLYLSVCILLLRLLRWSARILVFPTMPLYHLSFLNSSCLPVVCTTCVLFLNR